MPAFAGMAAVGLLLFGGYKLYSIGAFDPEKSDAAMTAYTLLQGNGYHAPKSRMRWRRINKGAMRGAA